MVRRCLIASIIYFISLAHAPPASASLLLNEILPNPSSENDATEWIELYNSSSTDLTLSSFRLADIASFDNPFHIPDTTLPAGSYLLLGRSLTGLNLNNSQDAVYLFDSSNQIIDEFHYENAPTDISFCRLPDGGEWSRCHQPSPDSPNLDSPPSPTITLVAKSIPVLNEVKVRLSEIMACSDATESEWVEIENISSHSVSLDNWKLIDAVGSSHTFSLTLPARSFGSVTWSRPFLNNSGDSLTLLDNSAQTVSSATFGKCSPQTSFIREADWGITTIATKGSPNHHQPPTTNTKSNKKAEHSSPAELQSTEKLITSDLDNRSSTNSSPRPTNFSYPAGFSLASVAGILDASTAASLSADLSSSSSATIASLALHSGGAAPFSYFAIGLGLLLISGYSLYNKSK